MNPFQVLQMKGMAERFHRSHPKVQKFFDAAMDQIEEGSVIEITLTTRQGKILSSNIRVTQEDMEALGQLREWMKEKE